MDRVDAVKRMGLEWTMRDWGRPKGKATEGALRHGQSMGDVPILFGTRIAGFENSIYRQLRDCP